MKQNKTNAERPTSNAERPMVEALRIRAVPVVVAKCMVCDLKKYCSYFDHDLRGHVCLQDSASVIAAEIELKNAGIEIPLDSILEGGLGL